jgi:ornithine carbamoyltransferase
MTKTISQATKPTFASANSPAQTFAAKDLLSIADLGAAEINALFDSAVAAKADPTLLRGQLAGKSVIMLFEKASLRTRVSFEVGIAKMGGHPMYFDHSAQRIGQRESVKDYAKNLERWVDCIIARTHSHAVLTEMAAEARIPVVNALSDLEHPCQALADFFTLRERFGSLRGLRLAYVGDGNNVCHSLMLAAATFGVDFTAISPRGFEPQFAVLKTALARAGLSGSTIKVTNSLTAAEGHHAVYTDTWVSMGQDKQASDRHAAFEGYTVDAGVMARASAGLGAPAAIMHCPPAHRGVEVTDQVIDSPESLVYEQAENRMHVQNALLAALLGVR